MTEKPGGDRGANLHLYRLAPARKGQGKGLSQYEGKARWQERCIGAKLARAYPYAGKQINRRGNGAPNPANPTSPRPVRGFPG